MRMDDTPLRRALIGPLPEICLYALLWELARLHVLSTAPGGLLDLLGLAG